MDFLIVVNGLPGAGKTTLAKPLAQSLGVPLIPKDAIKEAIAEAAAVDLPTTRLGALAMDVMWSIAGMLEGTVMLESFWASGRDEPYFARGYASIGSPPGIELWCEAGLQSTRERFRTRDRHSVHKDSGRLDQWERWAADCGPISQLPTLTVATEVTVEVESLAAGIRARYVP